MLSVSRVEALPPDLSFLQLFYDETRQSQLRFVAAVGAALKIKL